MSFIIIDIEKPLKAGSYPKAIRMVCIYTSGPDTVSAHLPVRDRGIQGLQHIIVVRGIAQR